MVFFGIIKGFIIIPKMKKLEIIGYDGYDDTGSWLTFPFLGFNQVTV